LEVKKYGILQSTHLWIRPQKPIFRGAEFMAAVSGIRISSDTIRENPSHNRIRNANMLKEFLDLLIPLPQKSI
jgi:hypothetical protein